MTTGRLIVVVADIEALAFLGPLAPVVTRPQPERT
jgi:hypothetical protein